MAACCSGENKWKPQQKFDPIDTRAVWLVVYSTAITLKTIFFIVTLKQGCLDYKICMWLIAVQIIAF